jgi:2-alkyl-3-oxoalkanoate reductase
MRVFIAGASGTLGLPLVRSLAQDGHTVIGLTRSATKRRLVEAAGGEATVADALNAEAVLRAVQDARPTHVVNLLTAIPQAGALRPRDLTATNRLRREGSANLLRASVQAGARRMVAESFVAVYGGSPNQGSWKEDDPLPAIVPTEPTADIVVALRELEAQHADAARVGSIETVVLRYGLFYGPAVPSTEALLENLRRGTMFFPKNRRGTASWIHIADAVSATLAALAHPHPGAVYNIADDEPLGMWEVLTRMADALGTRPPRSVPMWMLRWAAPLAAGMADAGLTMDNAKAKRELNWMPSFPNLAAGFADLARIHRRVA